jgi:hypothetical protein
MAGDWIKVRGELLSHPKLVRISCACRADKLRALGALVCAWSIFDIHSEDGILEGYTPDILDEIVGMPGLSTAMNAVGWLEYLPENTTSSDVQSLVMPRFDNHNGKSAKRRAMNTERMRDEREKLAQEAQTVFGESAPPAHKKRTRSTLEKRREDHNNPLPLSAGKPDTDLPYTSEDFTDAWALWETSRREARKPITPTARSLQLKKLRAMGEPLAIATLTHSAENGYTGLFPPKDQQPARAYGKPVREAPASRQVLNYPEPRCDWRTLCAADYGEIPLTCEWSHLPEETQRDLLANLAANGYTTP